jgi:hypothetical protein
MTEPTCSMTNAAQVERHRRCRAAMLARVGDLISHGTPLYAIAQQRGLPNLATLHRWLAENADLRKAYEEAGALREDYAADDAVMLADTLAEANNTGLRLRLDARKWGLSVHRKDRKDGSAARKAGIREQTERLVRALERVRKSEEEEIRQREEATEQEADDSGSA